MFSAIPSKISGTFFIDTDKLILKCIWNEKGLKIVKTIFEELSGKNDSSSY